MILNSENDHEVFKNLNVLTALQLENCQKLLFKPISLQLQTVLTATRASFSGNFLETHSQFTDNMYILIASTLTTCQRLIACSLKS
jgi:hypothetical protein